MSPNFLLKNVNLPRMIGGKFFWPASRATWRRLSKRPFVLPTSYYAYHEHEPRPGSSSREGLQPKGPNNKETEGYPTKCLPQRASRVMTTRPSSSPMPAHGMMKSSRPLPPPGEPKETTRHAEGKTLQEGRGERKVAIATEKLEPVAQHAAVWATVLVMLLAEKGGGGSPKKDNGKGNPSRKGGRSSKGKAYLAGTWPEILLCLNDGEENGLCDMILDKRRPGDTELDAKRKHATPKAHLEASASSTAEWEFVGKLPPFRSRRKATTSRTARPVGGRRGQGDSVCWGIRQLSPMADDPGAEANGREAKRQKVISSETASFAIEHFDSVRTAKSPSRRQGPRALPTAR